MIDLLIYVFSYLKQQPYTIRFLHYLSAWYSTLLEKGTSYLTIFWEKLGVWAMQVKNWIYSTPCPEQVTVWIDKIKQLYVLYKKEWVDEKEELTHRTWITAGVMMIAAYLFIPLQIDMVRQLRLIAIVLLVTAIGIIHRNMAYWMFITAILLYITLIILKDM